MSDAAEQRRRWARSLIRKAKSLPPSYGSPAWLALPEGSAEKVAAVVVAAECWAVDADGVTARLERQLDDERHAFKRAEDADYQARAAEHREQWRHLRVVRPLYDEQQVVRPLEEIGAQYVAEQRGAAK
jgi:hypothetical protein